MALHTVRIPLRQGIIRSTNVPAEWHKAEGESPTKKVVVSPAGHLRTFCLTEVSNDCSLNNSNANPGWEASE